MEKLHEGVEAILIGAADEAAEGIGKQVAPGLVALGAPSGVGGALGGTAVEGDKAAGGGIVGGETAAARKLAFPRVIDAESHGLVAALQEGPALGDLAGWEIAEPDERGVFGGRLC